MSLHTYPRNHIGLIHAFVESSSIINKCKQIVSTFILMSTCVRVVVINKVHIVATRSMFSNCILSCSFDF